MKAAVHARSEHPEGASSLRVLRIAAAAFAPQLPRTGELSIIVTTDATIRDLNARFRSKRKATDVLSFPQPEGSPVLGDVAISLDTARRQAVEHAHPVSVELRRLLAHGLLHLCGFDHEIPADAARMARAEIALLGTIGMVAESLPDADYLHPKDLDFRRGARQGSRIRGPTEHGRKARKRTTP